MTVKELIKYLQLMDRDLDVVIEDGLITYNIDTVWLESLGKHKQIVLTLCKETNHAK